MLFGVFAELTQRRLGGAASVTGTHPGRVQGNWLHECAFCLFQWRTAGLAASTLTVQGPNIPHTTLLSLCRHLNSQFWLPGSWRPGEEADVETRRICPHHRSEEKLHLNFFSTAQKGFQTNDKNAFSSTGGVKQPEKK